MSAVRRAGKSGGAPSEPGGTLIELAIVVAVLGALLGFVLFQNRAFQEIAEEQIDQASALMRLPEQWAVLKWRQDSLAPELRSAHELDRLLTSGLRVLRPIVRDELLYHPEDFRSAICGAVISVGIDGAPIEVEAAIGSESGDVLVDLCWNEDQARGRFIRRALQARVRPRGDETQYFVVFQYVDVDSQENTLSFQWRIMYGGVEGVYLGFEDRTLAPSSSPTSSTPTSSVDRSSGGSSSDIAPISSAGSSDGSSDGSAGSSAPASSANPSSTPLSSAPPPSSSPLSAPPPTSSI